MGGKKGKSETEDGIAPGLEDFEKELSGAGVDLERVASDEIETPADDQPTSDEVESGADDQPTGEEDLESESDLSDEDLDEDDAASVDEPTSTETAEPTFKIPDDKFFGELRGKEATVAELLEAGLLEKVLSRDNQVSHYQKLYEEEKEGRKAIEDRVAKLETPAEPKEPEMTPEEYQKAIESEFSPIAQGLVDAGLVESDFVTMNPRKAALDEYRVAVVSKGMDDFDKRIKALEERVEPWQEKEQTNTAVANVGNILVGMIKDNEQLYGALKDEAVQDKFFDYLQNPENGVRFTPANATPKDMRGAWLSFLLDTEGQLPTTTTETPKPKGQKGVTSTGGKPRGRGAKPAGGPDNEFDQFERELEEAERARFSG